MWTNEDKYRNALDAAKRVSTLEEKARILAVGNPHDEIKLLEMFRWRESFEADRKRRGIPPGGTMPYDNPDRRAARTAPSEPKTVTLPRPCEWCGVEFLPLRNNGRFCSDTCRWNASSERKRKRERNREAANAT